MLKGRPLLIIVKRFRLFLLVFLVFWIHIYAWRGPIRNIRRRKVLAHAAFISMFAIRMSLLLRLLLKHLILATFNTHCLAVQPIHNFDWVLHVLRVVLMHESHLILV